MQNKLDISVVVPLFNEVESLPELTSWIDKVMQANNFSYEVLLMDDGSNDGSWELIKELAVKNPSLKGVSFKRNYGKSAALNVAFEQVVGDVVITMDADLQDSPDEIPGLYKMIVEEGFDLVSGWKQKRHDPIMKTIPSKFFNWTTRKVSGIKLNDFNCGLKAYRNEVVKSIEVQGEMHRYIPVIAKWSGYANIGEKVVQHQERKYGVSKFGLSRFVNGYLDLLTIFFMGKFGKRPMHFFGAMGSIFFIVGFLITAYLIGDKIFFNIQAKLVADRTEFYVALTAMMIGSQLFLAGFIGELISRTAVGRSDYQIKQKIN